MTEKKTRNPVKNVGNLVLNTKINVIMKTFIYAGVVPALFYGLFLVTLHYSNYFATLNETQPPVYWIYYKGNDESHLKHVVKVLERLGFHRGTNNSDWDLLWAHDYPFRSLSDKLRKLQPYQKVNHIPGCGYITNKVDLSTTQGIKYIPQSFKIPEDREALNDYVEKNPRKLFVQKSNSHREISIKKLENIDLNKQGSFVQEYIDKPYLVDGYKFDIGVYTVITSVNPLRVYAYKGDVLFRFCPHQYYPFDAADLDKYVVGDDYLPIWNVPSLRDYYINLGYSMKDTFDAYVRSTGENPDEIWTNIYTAIAAIALKKEQEIANVVKQFGSQRSSFFELVRFDFVLDEDLNVFMMEANMSPNLSSAHYPPNRLLYEQVLFNLFALTGIGQKFAAEFRRQSLEEREMEVADKNLVALADVCVTCTDCFRVECQLCRPCFTDEMRLILQQCYIEHQNKMDYKRIFPPAITKNMSLKDYSMRNQLLVRWYQGKCAIDSSWCE